MPAKVIAFTGRKRSGKDTAAQIFVDHGAYHIKMADALKHMLGQLMAMQGATDVHIRASLEGDLKEEPNKYLNGRTPRHAMQTLGTEWGRRFMGGDFWVNIFSTIATNAPDGTLIVCSDVRFPNEVEAIHKLGGQVYRIERDGTQVDDHESERMIDSLKVDGTIYNSSTKENFERAIETMFGPVGIHSVA